MTPDYTPVEDTDGEASDGSDTYSTAHSNRQTVGCLGCGTEFEREKGFHGYYCPECRA